MLFVLAPLITRRGYLRDVHGPDFTKSSVTSYCRYERHLTISRYTELVHERVIADRARDVTSVMRSSIDFINT